MGNKPANTRGLICLNPGRLSVLGRFSRVMVSPTGAPSISLMPGDHETDVTGCELRSTTTWREAAELVGRVAAPGGHDPQLVAGLQTAVHDTDQ